MIEMEDKNREKRRELRAMRIAEGLDNDDDEEGADVIVMRRDVDEAAHLEDLLAMNSEQQKIFDEVMQVATDQVSKWVTCQREIDVCSFTYL